MMSSPSQTRRAMKKGFGSTGGQNIKVFVRVRPMNKIEKECKAHCLVECPNSKDVVVQERANDKITKKFSFDKVFNPDSKQVDIYKAVAKPLVEEVLNGFNCTICAYGQTGTGKTFTMEGDGLSLMEDNPAAGIIPRCVNHLFDELRCQKLEFTMRVSFLELYNEELFDLLSAHDDLSKLRIYEDCARKGSCIIQGLEEVLVRCKADVYRIIEKGSAKRQTAATMMNAHSSRSHTIFTVTVHIKENTEDGDELLKTGKLHLVDLAGSENIGRSGAVDKRAREAGNINQSLLTFGRVITSLVENAPHKPYRESKLTRLLQDALGGRTKTSIIATISPAHINVEETLSTLDYAHRAKNIQNKPEVNQRLNKKELIGEYTNEIERLRRDLLAMREKNGVYLANENYQEMIATLEQQEREITEKIALMKVLGEEVEKYTEFFNEANKKLFETSEKLNSTESCLESTKLTLQCTQKLLSRTTAEKEEQKYLVQAHCKTEEKLHDEGNNLINAAHTTSSDISKLHDKLDRKRKVECLNSKIEKTFTEVHMEKVADMDHAVMKIRQLNEDNTKIISEDTRMCLSNIQDKLSNISTEGKLILNSNSRACQDLKITVHSMVDKFDNFEMLDSLRNRSAAEKESLKIFKEVSLNSSNALISDLINQQSQVISDLKKYVIEKVTSLEDQCKSVCKEQSTLISSIEMNVQNLIALENSETKALLARNQAEENQIEDDFKADSVILAQVDMQLLKMNEWMHTQMTVITDQMKMFVKEMTTQMAMEVQQIKSQLQEMQCGQSSRKSRIVQDLHQLSDEQEKKLVNLESTSRQIMNDSSCSSSLVVGHGEHSIKTIDNIKTHINDEISKLESHMHSLNKERSCLVSVVDNQVSSVLEALSNAEHLASEHKCITSEAMTSCKESSNELFDNYIHKLNADLEKQQICLSNEQSNLTLSIEEICKKLSDCELNICEKLYNHRSELISYGKKVENLLSQELVKDVPTGLTPVRKDYIFPRSLSRTSPHDRLLERHRSRIHSSSKIPLPSLSQDNDCSDETYNSNLYSKPLSCNASISESVSSICSSIDNDINLPLSRSESFKEFVFREPCAPDLSHQEDKENDQKFGYSLSRSSSTSSLDSKENCEMESMRSRQFGNIKKRELRNPISLKSYNSDKNITAEIKPRKILGSHN